MEEFSIEDARRAQLVKTDKAKSGWMAYPKNMLFWRCISNAVKMHAPDLLGGMPVYTEADPFVDSTAKDVTDGGTAVAAKELDVGPTWAAIQEALGKDPDNVYGRLLDLTEDWPAARVQMTLSGRSADDLRTLAVQLQDQADAAAKEKAEEEEEIKEATVIEEDADAEPTPPPTEEPLDDTVAVIDPDADPLTEEQSRQLEELGTLRLREDHLQEALQGMDLMSERYSEVTTELDQVQERIRELSGSDGDIAF